MSERWTIRRLVEIAAEALRAAGYTGQHSARVREVPDQRTIRYYTTLGLIDSPLEMRGRTAYYGRQHVLQLVAVKRLQANGLSLVEVQRSLVGIDDRQLAELANLPERFWQRVERVEEPLEARSVEPFWAQTTQTTQTAQTAPITHFDTSTRDQPSKSWSCRPAVHLTLARGVRLVLEGVEPSSLDARILTQLAPDLENLLTSLSALGLIDTERPKTTDSNIARTHEEEKE